MASKSSDGYLWLSLVILGYFGSLAVHRQLTAIRQASEITRHDKRPNISQQTEDALKLKALGELTQSPDLDIRAASVKIITDRVVREGPAWDMMISDIAGTDIERRDKALTCFRFLGDSFPHNKQSSVVIRRHSTYKAIVECLCNLLPEARAAEKASAFRKQPERDALYVLNLILAVDVVKALEAGVISKWLVRYPFGGPDASRYKKKKNVMDIIVDPTYYEDFDFGHTMCSMLRFMSESPALRKEMVEHGLLDVSRRNDTINNGDMPEVPPRADSYTVRARRGIFAGTSIRPREESFEEQALRRRRREAMVLGEVGRPIERADIIERDSTTRDDFRSRVLAPFDDELEEIEESVAAVADDDLEERTELSAEEINQTESLRDEGWWGWLRRLRPDGLAPEPDEDSL